MSDQTAQNKAALRYYVEQLNHRNYAVLDELVASQVVTSALHEPDNPLEQEIISREDYRQGILGRIAAFPDYQVTILDMLAEGERVMLYWSYRGTQQGAYAGVPATGRVMREYAMSIYRFVDNQIVEVHGFWDRASLWQQLGLIPPADKILP